MALWHSINLLFTAKDLASDVIRRMERSFGSLGKSAKIAAGGIAGAFVSIQGMQMGGAALRGMYELAEGAGRFEQKLGLLKVAAQGAEEGFIELAKAKAIESGLTSRSDASAAVEGMTELAKAGMQATDVLGMVNQALSLVNATQGEMNVGEAAKMMAQVRAAFAGGDVPSPDLIVNAAAKYAMETQASLTEVPKVLSRMLGGAISMRQNFADVMAGAAVARMTNTSPEMMSTSMRYIMQKLAGTTGMGKFEKFTGVKVKDAAGNFKPLLALLAEMDQSPIFKRMDEGDQSEFFDKTFGNRQTSAIQGIRTVLNKMGLVVEENGKKFKLFGEEAAAHMLKGFRESAETNKILEYQAADIKTLGGLIDWIGAKLRTLKIQFGEAFLPILRPVAVAINTTLEWFGKFFAAIPTGVKGAIGGFILFGAVAFTASMAVGFLVSALAILIPILIAIKGFLLVWFVMPALTAAAAMTMLVGAGVALYAAWKNNIGGMGDLFNDWVKKAKLGFEVMKQLFERGGTWGNVHAQLMAPENKGLLQFLQNVWIWLNRIRNFAKGVWEGFKQQLESFTKPIQILMESLNGLLKLFGISNASADANRETYNEWGNAGRNLGVILANVAQMGIMMLVFAIETLADIMRAFGFGDKDPNAGKKFALNLKAYTQLGSALAGQGKFSDAYATWSDLKKLENADMAKRKAEEDALIERNVSPAERSIPGLGRDYLLRRARENEPEVNYPLKPEVGPHPASAAIQASGAGAPAASVNNITIQPQPMHLQVKVGEAAIADAVATVMRAQEYRGYKNTGALPWSSEP